jgi:hypothetical protein
MALQPTLFSTDPWTIMRQAIKTDTPTGAKDEALALLEQAQDYYRATVSSSVAAAKPVLLYYCYLNTAKAFLLHRAKRTTYEKAQHGLEETLAQVSKPRELHDAILIAHASGSKINVFPDLYAEIAGTSLTGKPQFKLVNLIPQIVPGHRQWEAASGKPERFVSIERIELAHSTISNDLWVNVVLDSADLTRLDCPQGRCLQESGLDGAWRNVRTPPDFAPIKGVLFEQMACTPFGQHPSQEIQNVVSTIRPHIWCTILNTPPYRRYYLYLCPQAETSERLPQLLSMYALMYYLGSITRYRPQHFDKIVADPFGGFIQSCLEDQPRQFLYLMASEFAKQEVTQPALV